MGTDWKVDMQAAAIALVRVVTDEACRKIAEQAIKDALRDPDIRWRIGADLCCDDSEC